MFWIHWFKHILFHIFYITKVHTCNYYQSKRIGTKAKKCLYSSSPTLMAKFDKLGELKDEFDESNKLIDRFDESDKLDCKFNELDKLNMSWISWLSGTVSSMS